MFTGSEKNKLDKLAQGCTFAYDKQLWLITEVAEYDWQSDGKSVEYTIISKDKQTAYLEVEFTEGEYEIYFSKEVFVDQEILEDAIENEIIEFKGKEFELEEDYRGAYKNITTQSAWEQLESYLFYKKNKILTIEKWQDGSYESFYGFELKKKAITNITPL